MDTITIPLAADEYQGDAIAVVTIDGVAQPPVTVSAVRSAGAWQDAIYSVPPAPHIVSVEFTNDAWGGEASKDRNLYIGDITGPMGSLGNSVVELMTVSAHTWSVPSDPLTALLASITALQTQLTTITAIVATQASEIAALQAKAAALGGA